MNRETVNARLARLEQQQRDMAKELARLRALALSAQGKVDHMGGYIKKMDRNISENEGRQKAMKVKYLIFDLVKLALPLIATQFLPDGAPSNEIVTSLLYILATVLGVDSVAKTINAIRSDGE